LSRLRVPVPSLGIRQRPDLIKTGQVGPEQSVRLALVEIPPQPDMPVREREHRLGLSKPLEVKLDLAQRPRVDQKRRMLDHALLPPAASALAVTILGDLIFLQPEGFSCGLVLDAGCREV
jgi:hypothetical protein